MSGDPKQFRALHRGAPPHWVGDGFPVRTLFSYDSLGAELSPFLLLDFGGPATFPATTERRGVGPHPHRGFETVTIVFDGEVEHRDSAGGGGTIGPGDVQWMTAGAGLVHEEFHGRDFARRGGRFEMVQLWVNLPRAKKRTPPRYQALRNAAIPRLALDDGAGELRVIAGSYGGAIGPAETATPIEVWDLRLAAAARAYFTLAEGATAALVVLDGELTANGSPPAHAAEFVLLDRRGRAVHVESRGATHALLLAGAPIDEPIVGRGPFVMNDAAEIRQAIADFNAGKMGRLDP